MFYSLQLVRPHFGPRKTPLEAHCHSLKIKTWYSFFSLMSMIEAGEWRSKWSSQFSHVCCVYWLFATFFSIASDTMHEFPPLAWITINPFFHTTASSAETWESFYCGACFVSDVDECGQPSLNDCDTAPKGKCHNVHGSFVCRCLDGYRMCQDKNRCEGESANLSLRTYLPTPCQRFPFQRSRFSLILLHFP